MSCGATGSPYCAAIVSMLRWKPITEHRLRCVCTAPFGRPDVPDVKRMTAGSSSSTAALGSGASGCSVARRSWSSSRLIVGVAVAVSARSARRRASATTSFGVVSSSASCSSRADHQALQPTAIAPIDTVAQKVSIQAGELAASMATRSPLPIPYVVRSSRASEETRRACSAKVRRP